MPLDLPPSVLHFFEAAGWTDGGRRPPPGFSGPASHPAVAVLGELNGLTVGECGPGDECARSDIAFGFDPEHQDHPAVLQWQEILGAALVNIAEVHHAHGVLLMDAGGACYGLSLVHDAFSLSGHTFGEAVQRLLLGRRARPMLRPGQASVHLYGEVFMAGHPGIYRHE